jgi:hypothetical protein
MFGKENLKKIIESHIIRESALLKDDLNNFVKKARKL